MTRKTQDTPSSIRLRENQQRSRARRKELIESLQKRVQEFELNGVKATQEVQQAARRVVVENERLRSLLALRGVTQVEIDSYLRSFDQAGPKNDSITDKATLKTCASGRAQKSKLAAAPRSNPVSLTADPVTYDTNTNAYSRNNSAIGDQTVVVASQGTSQPCDNLQLGKPREYPQGCVPIHEQNPEASTTQLLMMAQNRSQAEVVEPTDLQPTQNAAAEKDLCPSRPDCFCPSTVEVGEASPSNGLDTSCDIAAKIIIDMGGNGDKDLVRASLGCASEDECRVRNTTVLQVMGELLR